MNNGLFITVEGPDGSGKTTLINHLQTHISSDAVFTREPGGSPVSEEIRTVLLNSNKKHPLVEALLINAARVQHNEDIIKPALKEGKLVICDRYRDTTFAYQGAAGLSREVLENIEKDLDIAIPHVTILLDGDIKEFAARVPEAKRNYFEEKGLSFQYKCRDTFIESATRKQHDTNYYILNVSSDLSQYELVTAGKLIIDNEIQTNDEFGDKRGSVTFVGPYVKGIDVACHEGVLIRYPELNLDFEVFTHERP